MMNLVCGCADRNLQQCNCKHNCTRCIYTCMRRRYKSSHKYAPVMSHYCGELFKDLALLFNEIYHDNTNYACLVHEASATLMFDTPLRH